MCICLYLSVCLYVSVYVCLYLSVYVSVHVCVCVCVGVVGIECGGQGMTFRSWFFASIIWVIGIEPRTQVISFGSKHPYLLSHLPNPSKQFFKDGRKEPGDVGARL